MANRVKTRPPNLWFAWTLWLTSVCYTALRALRRREHRPTNLQSDRAFFFLGLLVGVVSYGVRTVAPIGFDVAHIQIAYVPQYLGMFCAGAAANRYALFLQKSLRLWLAIVTLSLLAAAAVYLVLAHGNADKLRGGGGLSPFGWAVAEAIGGTSISGCLPIVFRARFSSTSTIAVALSANAYAAFVFHAPIVVGVALLVSRLAELPLVGLIISVFAAIPLSFAIGALAREVPLTNGIL